MLKMNEIDVRDELRNFLINRIQGCLKYGNNAIFGDGVREADYILKVFNSLGVSVYDQCYMPIVKEKKIEEKKIEEIRKRSHKELGEAWQKLADL